jgi:hypothetical protein
VGSIGRYKQHLVLGWMGASTAIYVFFISRWGFGTSPDSIVYIAGARSIAGGDGFAVPSTTGAASPILQFPPLFSAGLSVFGLFGMDPLEAASVLNATLLAVNVFLSGLLVYHATRSPAAAYIAAAVILTAPTILTTHAMVWSEALFLFLLILTAFAIGRYLQAPGWSHLLWVIAPVLLAPLVRYAGVAVLIAAAVTIARRGKFKHAVACATAGSLGFLAWLLRNYLQAGDLTTRRLVFHPPIWEQLALGSQTVLEWFGGLLLAVTFVGLILLTLLRREQYNPVQGGANFLRDFAIVYAAVLLFSLHFVDAQTPLDRRILAPLYLPLFLYAVVWIASNVVRPMSFAWVGYAMIVILLNSWTSISWLHVLSTQGFGFSSAMWRFSPTMNYLKKHKATPMYTNAPDPVFLLVGTPAAMLPRHADPGTRAANPNYAAEMAGLEKNGGIIVYFRAVTWRWYLPVEDRLLKELPLFRVAELGDGAVYVIAPALR